MTGTATAISDRNSLVFTVNGDEITFYEPLPSSWSARVERTERRKRQVAS